MRVRKGVRGDVTFALANARGHLPQRTGTPNGCAMHRVPSLDRDLSCEVLARREAHRDEELWCMGTSWNRIILWLREVQSLTTAFAP